VSGTQTSTAAAPVMPGTWIVQTINGMQYDVLLPANYDPATAYPVMLYLHQLDMGNDPSGLLQEVDPWFNSTQFRTDHPAIVVMPFLDQSADPSGQTINWGGISTADSGGETNAIAALKQVMSQYKVDSSRVYLTGNSMGGIGTEDMLIKYNALTGTEGKVFTAGLALAGADYGQGYPQPNQSVVAGLKNVPFWAIHGGQDTQVPLAFDQNLFAAEQASGGIMKYTQDDSLGHDVWDTYYTQTGAGSPLSWLFSQHNGSTPVPTPSPTPTPNAPPSPNDTVVLAGSSAAITDAAGNAWTITGGGLVAVNGVADTTTSGVKELAYVNGTIWQENTSNLWWGETTPASGWSPAAGTSVSPLPATPVPTPTPTPAPVPPPVPVASPNDTVVLAGSNAAITDAAGNAWTITSGGQVAVNGTTDATTGSVAELAYVDGKIWQENADKLWWDKTKPTDAWGPAAGTATSPLPAVTPPGPTPVPTPTPPPTASANDTVVMAGSAAAIKDASGNAWTITGGGQAAVNGTPDATTGHVVELAYVDGKLWQENTSHLWWDKAKPTDAWAPPNGTAVSPLPASITVPANQASVTVSLSNISVNATAGDHLVFISGSGNTVNLTGGTETITDTGSGNTYVLPPAGKGNDVFTGNVLKGSAMLDLRQALKTTTWDGTPGSAGNYLKVADSAQGAVVSLSAMPGGAATAIASISGATTADLTAVLAHSIV
jgi:predicted esterase